LSAALRAANAGLRVLVVTKGVLGEGATVWAQGGLAAVLAATDSLSSHVDDTLTAGAGLCDRTVVEAVVSAAPAAIASLVELGARFDSTAGVIELGLEGGHRVPRIVHAGGDASGAEVVRVLADAVRSAIDSGRIELAEHTYALDARLDVAGRVAGLVVLSPTGVSTIGCRALVLATGGLGQAFAVTTNPAGATVTASPWRCGRVPSSPTWSSCSSTRRCWCRPMAGAPTTVASWCRRRCAVRAPCSWTWPATR
jgi:L-aspartate oxidase